MNEAETRAEHIDPALAAAGWGVVEGSRILREYPITLGRLEGHGRRGKSLTADYVLVYRNHKLAVVEAKAWDEALTEGVAQAKNYAAKLAIRYAYSTNGQGLYGIDMKEGAEGEAPGYPGPEELWDLTFAEANAWRDRFAAVPFEDKGGYFQPRYFQDIAIERALDAISAGKDRILLTLATGTGKTFIAFQIAWKLFHSRWNLSREPSRRPRILFLADRNILADQAYNAFSAFPEDAMVRIAPEDIRKKGRVPKNGSLFFTIFQTFMSGAPKDGQPSPYFGEYPPDFFDFIVIDECHRGGANDESNWRGILDYFSPAVQLGLTATPKRKDNVDTYAYFGDPVYIYSLKDGINDGYLTPFKVRQIATTLDEYIYTPDDQLIEGEIETGKRYTEADFNKIIEIKEREAHRVKTLAAKAKGDGWTIGGRGLHSSTLHLILRRRIYTGDFDWGGVIYGGRHEALISRETWEGVQALFDRRAETKQHRIKHDFAFTGFVRCGHCGCGLVGELKKQKYVYYHCTGYRGKCGEPYTREEAVQDQFAAALKELVTPLGILKWLQESVCESDLNEHAARDKEVARLGEQQRRLGAKLDVLYDDRLEGRISPEMYDRKAQECQKQATAVARRIEEIHAHTPAPVQNAIDLMELTSRAADLFSIQPPQEKQAFLRLILKSASWRHGELQTQFEEPFENLRLSNQLSRSKHGANGAGTAQDQIWYARVDSNHRPFAPEAHRWPPTLPSVLSYSLVFQQSGESAFAQPTTPVTSDSRVLIRF